MKKLILVFVAIAITAGAYAQADSTNRKMSPLDINEGMNKNRDTKDDGMNKHRDTKISQPQNVQNNPVDKSYSDEVMMQNGKMLMVKNGQTTILDNNTTLSNGTIIMCDGTYTKKDGTKMMLKEGQHMDMSGNMIPVKTDKDKNMYLVPDSTVK